MTTQLILAGAGHAHAQVLQAWARAPVPGVALVVVSPHRLAPYSGMVPGWLSGTYAYEDIVIDFEALCRRAGARWVTGTIDRLDPDTRTLHLVDGTVLPYDWLSLNIGSTLMPPPSTEGLVILPMRPLAALQAQIDALQRVVRSDSRHTPWRVMGVGGGAAGVESLLAIIHRLRAGQPHRPVTGTLLSRGPVLLPGYAPAAQRQALTALTQAGVLVRLNTPWTDAWRHEADVVLWATGAEAHAWQRDPSRRGSLSVSPAGFVCINEHLQSVSHDRIFAVGDCAQWTTPLPKAGVYAVRMGPVLAHNLGAALRGQPLQRYRPQATFLSLLATADGKAIATRGRLAVSGRWSWRWKDHIDRAFVGRFRVSDAGTRPPADGH